MNDTNTTYNGWTDRNTWLVKCWFEPQTKQDLAHIKNMLEDEFYAHPNGFWHDLVAPTFSSINWVEIEETLDNEEGEEA